MNEPVCGELRQLMPEVALGIAPIEDQARVLAHVTGCPQCRTHLTELSGLSDDILALVPPVEPPSGFESAVIAAVAADQPTPAAHRPTPADEAAPADQPATASGTARAPTRTRLVRALRLAVVFVLVAALAAGVVWWAGAEDRRVASGLRQTLATADGEYFVAFPVRDPAGARRGALFAYQGDPPWLYLSLDRPLPPGRYDIELVTRGGAGQPVDDAVDMTGRRGWGGAIALPVHEVALVLVLDDTGRVVLSAELKRS
ncbi:MAG: zf-HC2 domain-containing protein [Micromonosporaceae bacterium]